MTSLTTPSLPSYPVRPPPNDSIYTRPIRNDSTMVSLPYSQDPSPLSFMSEDYTLLRSIQTPCYLFWHPVFSHSFFHSSPSMSLGHVTYPGTSDYIPESKKRLTLPSETSQNSSSHCTDCFVKSFWVYRQRTLVLFISFPISTSLINPYLHY